MALLLFLDLEAKFAFCLNSHALFIFQVQGLTQTLIHLLFRWYFFLLLILSMQQARPPSISSLIVTRIENIDTDIRNLIWYVSYCYLVYLL